MTQEHELFVGHLNEKIKTLEEYVAFLLQDLQSKQEGIGYLQQKLEQQQTDAQWLLSQVELKDRQLTEQQQMIAELSDEVVRREDRYQKAKKELLEIYYSKSFAVASRLGLFRAFRNRVPEK